MTEEEFCKTDKLILNYFTPYSNGKFIASCLMLSHEVYDMIPPSERKWRLDQSDSWSSVEYSDIDFWWMDYEHDWFNTVNWYDNLTEPAKFAIQNGKYCFYTCHEAQTVNYLKQKFPNAKVLAIVPDFESTKANFEAKRNMDFKFSQQYDEFKAWEFIPSAINFHQTSIYDDTFENSITSLAATLGITLPLVRVMEYRSQYLKNKFMETAVQAMKNLH